MEKRPNESSVKGLDLLCRNNASVEEHVKMEKKLKSTNIEVYAGFSWLMPQKSIAAAIKSDTNRSCNGCGASSFKTVLTKKTTR